MLLVSNTTNAVSTSSGALIIAGGVSIGKDLYIGGGLYQNGQQTITTATVNQFANQTSITAGTDTAVSTSTGNIVIWNTSTLQSVSDRGNSTTNALLISNATSAVSITTGALTITGGVGIGSNLYVNGVINLNGQNLGFGYTGSTGTQGVIGNTGYTGSRGNPGTSVNIVGSTSTNTALPGWQYSYTGAAGDGYITADTGFLWVWGGTSWISAGKIVGPAGDVGFTGSRGAYDAIGFTGSAGTGSAITVVGNTTTLTNNLTKITFTGSGVSSTVTNNQVTITITGSTVTSTSTLIAIGNFDGGFPNSNYGGINSIDAGGVV